MGKKRHVYSGGNTCQGFYHFYQSMVNETVERKIILKGGPGVGKSSFMHMVGEHFANLGYDLEYHWCSSDPDSLDGIVIGDNRICFLDGTNPHMIDPKYPGAVDEIINLGHFWDREKMHKNRQSIITLTDSISNYFKLAYSRLCESGIAFKEMQFYIQESIHWPSVNKNILALSDDFLAAGRSSPNNTRHLFAAAITPSGLVTKLDSIVEEDYTIFAVSGSPGSGLQKLFTHLLHQIELNTLHAEIFHNPFKPDEIDLILFPETKTVIIDISANVIDYIPMLPSRFKRRLDFNLFKQKQIATEYEMYFNTAQQRYKEGFDAAVHFLAKAKTLHDELEAFYIPHMDFTGITQFRTNLIEELESSLKN